MERDLFKEGNFLSREALEKMPTPRILAYYKSKREGFLRGRYYHNEGYDHNDPVQMKYYRDVDDYVLFIKTLLNTREHVEKKK